MERRRHIRVQTEIKDGLRRERVGPDPIGGKEKRLDWHANPVAERAVRASCHTVAIGQTGASAASSRSVYVAMVTIASECERFLVEVKAARQSQLLRLREQRRGAARQDGHAVRAAARQVSHVRRGQLRRDQCGRRAVELLHQGEQIRTAAQNAQR